MRQPIVHFQKLSLLFAVLVAMFALASCCIWIPIPLICPSPGYSAKGHPEQPGQSNPSAQAARAGEDARVAKTIQRVSDRAFARGMGMQAGPMSTQSVAPFYGNQTVVGTTTADSFILVRRNDCSLTLGDYNLDYSNGTSTVTVTSTTPNYEKVIHDAALLSTTPDSYPNGCGSTALGAASANYAYLGQEKNNGAYVGAVTAGNSILTSAISSTYAVTTGPTLTPDISPYSLTAADLNKDGYLDLISINTDGLDSSVTVYLNNGDGTFATGVNYDLPSTVISWAVADDLDGDGNVDVLTNSENGSFIVFFGKGDGTLTAPPVSLVTGGQTSFFADKFITADVNGDKKLDIITEQGQVFLGTGDGITFTYAGLAFPAVGTATNGLAPGIVAADFNHDGKMDIATDDGLTIRTYLGNGSGAFTAGPAYATIPNRGLITGTDIDGDGNVDLWSGAGGDLGYSGDDYIMNQGYALLGNGDGTFAGAPSLPVAFTGANLGDLNGDGRPDLVAFALNSSSQAVFTSYLTQANGSPAQGQQLVLPVGQSGGTPVLGKFTGGSTEDLFWVGTSTVGALTFNLSVGNGDGSFQLPAITAAPSLVPPGGEDAYEDIQGVQTVDMNHDGKADLIYWFFDIDASKVPNVYYEGFAVQLGNGDGTFQAPKTTYTYNSTTSIFDGQSTLLAAIYDVNKDNFPDVFYVVPGPIVDTVEQTTVEVFLSNGDGTFQSPKPVTLTPNILPPSSVYGPPLAFADLNGDGNVDVVASGSSSDATTPTLAVALGNGDGTFKTPSTFTLEGFGYSGSPVLADFTGDEKIDLLVPGAVEGSGGVFPGNGDGTFQSVSNGDGTISPTQLIPLSLGYSGVAADFNGDGKIDALYGRVLLLNEAGATPPVTAATSTALTSSLNPSTVGASVTFTATVTSTTAGTITGTVNFLDGTTQIGTGTVGAGGVATYVTSTLTQGSHSITAQYAGDSNYSGSTSTAVTQVVNAAAGKATTSTGLTSSLNPSTVGASVTFTATVTSATAGTITGTVTFLDGTTQIGTGAVGAGGVATFATSALAQGSHSITAQYGGDSNYTGSTSTAVTQVVNAAAPIGTTTALSASATTATFGTNITFTATVSSMSAISKKAQISAAITGTVTFLDGSTPIGTGSVGTNGVATFSTTALAVGSHSITAQYGGDSTYNGSTSSPVTVVVNAATTISTMTALTASSTSATSGTNITFTATVTASAIAGKKSAALTAITGSVTFLDGTTQIGTGSVGANGVATYSTSALAAGSHSITAQYGGDPNYSGSTSPAVQVTITASGTFTLSANPASVTVTKSIPGTSTITVTPANGFNQNVALSCSGLPSGFSCTLAPPSVTPNGSPVTSTLTITDGLVPTSAPARKVVAALWPGSRGTGSGTGTFGPPARVALFALGGELMLVGLLFTRRKKLLAHSSGRLAFALLVGAIAITFMTGCAGSLPTQTTTVTVSATAGTQTVTTSLNVTLPN